MPVIPTYNVNKYLSVQLWFSKCPLLRMNRLPFPLYTEPVHGEHSRRTACRPPLIAQPLCNASAVAARVGVMKPQSHAMPVIACCNAIKRDHI